MQSMPPEYSTRSWLICICACGTPTRDEQQHWTARHHGADLQLALDQFHWCGDKCLQQACPHGAAAETKVEISGASARLLRKHVFEDALRVAVGPKHHGIYGAIANLHTRAKSGDVAAS
jgi:hypothetical protein